MAETKKPDAIGDAGAYTNFVSNIGTERDKASHGSFVKKVKNLLIIFIGPGCSIDKNFTIGSIEL